LLVQVSLDGHTTFFKQEACCIWKCTWYESRFQASILRTSPLSSVDHATGEFGSLPQFAFADCGSPPFAFYNQTEGCDLEPHSDLEVEFL